MPANILHYEVDISQTAASGAWNFNTVKLKSCLLRLIVVKANTSTTTFDFSITDSKNNIIYQTETKAIGTLREQVVIPMKDINTLAVSNASTDESFDGKLVCEE